MNLRIVLCIMLLFLIGYNSQSQPLSVSATAGSLLVDVNQERRSEDGFSDGYVIGVDAVIGGEEGLYARIGGQFSSFNTINRLEQSKTLLVGLGANTKDFLFHMEINGGYAFYKNNEAPFLGLSAGSHIPIIKDKLYIPVLVSWHAHTDSPFMLLTPNQVYYWKLQTGLVFRININEHSQ